MDWHSIKGGIILLVASCYRNRDKLRLDGSPGSYAHFTSKVSRKDATLRGVSSVYHKELVTNMIIDEKNVRDKLRLISALFPGIIISPFSSLIGCSRSGLGNSTTSGCYRKHIKKILRISTQVNHG